MPPRLIVKKRLSSNEPTSEELTETEAPKPKVKRLVKRVIKKVDTSTEKSKSPEPEVVEEDPMNVYLSSLNSFDRMVMDIAKDHLASSFCIEKSVGYVDFLASRK